MDMWKVPLLGASTSTFYAQLRTIFFVLLTPFAIGHEQPKLLE